MAKRQVAVLFLMAALAAAGPPAPRQVLGFEPGADYKLADSRQIYGYFRSLAAASNRIRLVEFGRSSEGRPMYVAFLSAPENLKRLDRYREISRRLALGEAAPEEARRLASEGKALVWIDSGLHATEVAPAQHSPELAWRMVAGESEEVEAIRRNVILMQVPVINPDGLDMVAEWYAGNVGTPYETAPLPRLYQKYAGHDNNRDWFMLNLPETRQVSRLLFREWFPHIVYNQHQQPAFPARIFVPPYADPLNPNIPAAVMEGINLIGMAIKERLARENKAGALSYAGFDAWWNGGLRSAPAFHNMHGILTETAGYAYATPRDYLPGEIPATFAGGLSAREPSMFYERPWLGGRWALRDAIEYMLTVDFAILNLAAARRADYLLKSWEMARASIQAGLKGNPFAYRLAPEAAGVEMAERLALAGIEVRRDSDGTLVLPAAQPFRAYLVDLMEPQKYPSGARRPYDVAGWTLPMLMGVEVKRIDAPFDLSAAKPCDADCLAALKRPQVYQAGNVRVAVYEPWTANSDAGWTEWLLDRYQIPYTAMHNQDLQSGGLISRCDVLVLPAQSAASILNGTRDGERGPEREGFPVTITVQRPEYAGGIGASGLANLERFVRQGGTLVALDTAADLPIQFFPLPVQNLARSPGGWSCPGSLLRLTLDTSHPLAEGVPKEITAFSTGGSAFDVTLAPAYNRGERAVATVARFAEKNLLASGWISGERAIAGKAALVEARHGQGRVILFGFRPQFRGQTLGTFKLLLNAIGRHEKTGFGFLRNRSPAARRVPHSIALEPAGGSMLAMTRSHSVATRANVSWPRKNSPASWKR